MAAAPLGTQCGQGDRKGGGKADAAEAEMGPRENAAMMWRRPVALIATTRRAGERGAVGVDGISITVQAGRYPIYRPGLDRVDRWIWRLRPRLDRTD